MEWISVKDELPKPLKKPWCNSIKVIACWGSESENVAEMDYCIDPIRGKEVARFKWYGKISPWKVTHWMPMPLPPAL